MTQSQFGMVSSDGIIAIHLLYSRKKKCLKAIATIQNDSHFMLNVDKWINVFITNELQ